MTIKKRLAVSNILMILVPVGISVLIAVGCIGVIWFAIARGTGVGFEDSEDFYQASTGIADIAAEALEYPHETEKQKALQALSSFLDRGAMSLAITENGTEYYRYGDAVGEEKRAQLEAAAAVLENNGTLSTTEYNLHVRQKTIDGTEYVIYLYNIHSELSYTSLKVIVVIACCIFILAIIFSIYFTNRFLTHFVFQKIEAPLDMLVYGVKQIRDGNLDYRLQYDSQDEFLPVCENFNAMAGRLKESVEQSQREEESRKELMAGISHDLRSPLTSIQAYTEGLLDGIAVTPDAQKRYLTTIKNKALELEQMVSRILAYSRLDLNDAPHENVSIQLDEYLHTQIAELSAEYAARGLDISAQLEPFTVIADRTELHQIFVNLADNSAKYKTKDHGHLFIALSKQGELRFTDDGAGVPAEALPKLFDVFYRTDVSRSDRSKGSGLGLAIVEKTIRRMGGTIKAENAKNLGLSIIINLPNGEEHQHVENSDC